MSLVLLGGIFVFIHTNIIFSIRILQDSYFRSPNIYLLYLVSLKLRLNKNLFIKLLYVLYIYIYLKI